MINTPLRIGSLTLPNRLIQGPLAGVSCSPFRTLFSSFESPAYCVSEMVSAQDVLTKHSQQGRYLHRATDEKLLCYQLSGTDPLIMAKAAAQLAEKTADLIDINCGCPKPKIRKKGAGSALLETPERLFSIVAAVRKAIACPLTVKIRLQDENGPMLAKGIEEAGADALIVHGRRWTEDYDIPCDLQQIAGIKQAVSIPVIANGDISDKPSVERALTATQCDAVMISRAGTGKPWLYKTLLGSQELSVSISERVALFMRHLQDLASLENEFLAVIQSRSLVRYYFREFISDEFSVAFNSLSGIPEIASLLESSFL